MTLDFRCLIFRWLLYLLSHGMPEYFRLKGINYLILDSIESARSFFVRKSSHRKGSCYSIKCNPVMVAEWSKTPVLHIYVASGR